MSLNFSYSGTVFAPSDLVLWSIHSRGVESAHEDGGRKAVENLSFLLVHCYRFASLARQGGCAFFDLPFLADIPVEKPFLLFFASLARFSSICA